MSGIVLIEKINETTSIKIVLDLFYYRYCPKSKNVCWGVGGGGGGSVVGCCFF